MKAMIFEKYGPPDVLELTEVEKPAPKDDEVLIRIHGTTVIMGDCEFRGFNFPLWFWLPLRLYAGLLRPKRVNILGQELAGQIEAIGKDVRKFKTGDKVFAATDIGFGAYAEYKCMGENKVIALKPDNMTYLEAAVVPTGGLNALHYIRRANIKPGDKVLIVGAAGNIGSFAVQLAKHFGGYVTAVDSPDKMDMLFEIGADQVIDYTREDFTKNGKSYDVIFDAVGKSAYSRSVRSLKPKGCYLLANPKFSQMIRSLWTPLVTGKKVIFQFAPYRIEDLIFLKGLIEAGEITSPIDRSYPLEQMAEAHRYVESGCKKGHVAITIG
ncbi:MAG: NAD(P)-dependent alcohol dehydrogenase [Alphaproteobacteria bacterium]|nr:NAD(P)-dependent alcohol dehydrogenase [Alphaproteobacteria bacterium]